MVHVCMMYDACMHGAFAALKQFGNNIQQHFLPSEILRSFAKAGETKIKGLVTHLSNVRRENGDSCPMFVA